MKPKILLDKKLFELIINRLCYELIENHDDFINTVIIGIQPRGVVLAELIYRRLKKIAPKIALQYGALDITFFRDDFRRREDPVLANTTKIDFLIEGKRVILVDDVLFTGRTIRSAFDALLAFGRPDAIELLVLIERRFSLQVPVNPKYVGKSVDSIASQRVLVKWKIDGEPDKVILHTSTDE
ncbi:MAG: bifunctional pyr operon transcriptional regulator/uracil phosphoribosyltransferase PyrR [Flavobacteriales bacterium]